VTDRHKEKLSGRTLPHTASYPDTSIPKGTSSEGVGVELVSGDDWAGAAQRPRPVQTYPARR